jgi:hypothetical protein
MKTINNNPNLLLECYFNGSFELLTPEEAKQRLRETDLYWFCPRDEYGSLISGHRFRERHLCKKVGFKALRLSLFIHTADVPYSMLQAEKDINNKKHFNNPNVFHSWKMKFNRIFRIGKRLRIPKKLLPFEYLEVPVPNTRFVTCPAYKLNPAVNTLVVVGPDQDSNFTNNDIPWDFIISQM